MFLVNQLMCTCKVVLNCTLYWKFNFTLTKFILFSEITQTHIIYLCCFVKPFSKKRFISVYLLIYLFIWPIQHKVKCLFSEARRGNGKAPCGKLNSPFPIECALENPWGSVAICLRRSTLKVIMHQTHVPRDRAIL